MSYIDPRRSTGIGFLPIPVLAAAIPAVASAFGAGKAADAQKSAAKAATEQAKIAAAAQAKSDKAAGKRLKTILWVGGGVLVLTVGIVALARRRKRRER